MGMCTISRPGRAASYIIPGTNTGVNRLSPCAACDGWITGAVNQDWAGCQYHRMWQEDPTRFVHRKRSRGGLRRARIQLPPCFAASLEILWAAHDTAMIYLRRTLRGDRPGVNVRPSSKKKRQNQERETNTRQPASRQPGTSPISPAPGINISPGRGPEGSGGFEGLLYAIVARAVILVDQNVIGLDDQFEILVGESVIRFKIRMGCLHLVAIRGFELFRCCARCYT